MRRILLVFSMAVTSLTLCAQDVTLPERPQNRRNYRDYSLEESGYWTAIEGTVGSTAMFNRKNMPFGGVSWINGYRFSEFLRVGIGIGFKYHLNNDKVKSSSIPWSFPIFADVRGNIVSQQDRSSVPYWSVDLGGEIRGGLYFTPTIGYRLGMSRSCFLLGIGYKFTQSDTWRKGNEGLNSIVIKLGYEF